MRPTHSLIAVAIAAQCTTLLHADDSIASDQPVEPIVQCNSNGELSFDTTDDMLRATLSPRFIKLHRSLDSVGIQPSSDRNEKHIEIGVCVDEQGHLVGGIHGPDVTFYGAIDFDGDGVIDFDNLLLFGEAISCSCNEVNNAGQIDDERATLLLTFAPTGGALAPFYEGRALTVELEVPEFEFEKAFADGFLGSVGGRGLATQTSVGACCLFDGSCEELDQATCFAVGGVFQAGIPTCTPGALGQTGTYRLENHPANDAWGGPPSYGLRLDELFDVTPLHDAFTFDFEHPEAAMFMEYNDDQLHVWGVAYGGLDAGDTYHPRYQSHVIIDFTYDLATPVPFDDDLFINPTNDRNHGTLIWVQTGAVIDLYDHAGPHDFSFRFGDENDDGGHRGWEGLSGWGWINHHDPEQHTYTSDWLFTAVPICEEFDPGVGACCLLDGTCDEEVSEEACGLSGGIYLGNETICGLINCKSIKIDCCSNGPPASLTMLYTGGSCHDTDHQQDPLVVTCSGNPDEEAIVFIRASESSNPFDVLTNVWYEGIVQLNQPFAIRADEAGQDQLGALTYIHIFRPGGDLLQTARFATSCTQPLFVGDVFGASVVIDCQGHAAASPEDLCANGRPTVLELTYHGSDCSMDHSQLNSTFCEGASQRETIVRIITTDVERFTSPSARIWFDGWVIVDDTFTIDAGSLGLKQLGDQTWVHIFDLEGNLKQSIAFDSSCDQKLEIGDRFASVTVTGPIEH